MEMANSSHMACSWSSGDRLSHFHAAYTEESVVYLTWVVLIVVYQMLDDFHVELQVSDALHTHPGPASNSANDLVWQRSV